MIPDLRRFIDAVATLTETSSRIDANTLARAIHNHWTYDQGETVTMGYVRDTIADVRALAKGSLTIWRALHFKDFEFDAHDLSDEDEIDSVAVARLRQLIDWKKLGTSWTNNRVAAVFNGALSNSPQPTTILLQTEVQPRQVNWVATIWHRCTVYQEEEEIRLWCNMPLTVTATIPLIAGLPKRGNTGPERWAGDERVDDEIRTSAARPVQRLTI